MLGRGTLKTLFYEIDLSFLMSCRGVKEGHLCGLLDCLGSQEACVSALSS